MKKNNPEIDRKELKKFLKENKFKDINYDDVFEKDDMTVYVDTEDDGISVSFGHSELGYRNINNPTFEQIKNLTSIYKESEYHSTSDSDDDYPQGVKERYGFLLINEFKKFLKNKK